ncbi:glyoxylate/hydroxypyruvate reductase A-like [Hydractinia symbiolongicarpus]|uniref:glyoxylate/hydroxypyruvate reductase A-like n=1 Tax=Hydractinia symbiolongicarpus TaxID=13093 RepID=UPI0025510073|nr:glyoxylate/hydroxypyruvate reductase A-like [Hydractinia symbiolongicarpus]
MQAIKRKIGVLTCIKNLHKDLKQRLPHYEIEEIPLPKNWKENGFGECLERINSNEILLTEPHYLSRFVYDVKNVKWVQLIWAGVDNVTTALVPGEAHPSFVLTRFGGQFGQHISEYVVSNIINMERKAFKYYENQKISKWEKLHVGENPYRLLSTLSVCVLGIGDLGAAVAKQCKSFGMTVYGMSTKVPDVRKVFFDEYFTLKDLPLYLSRSDYVCNTLPKTPATDNLLSNNILKQCMEKQSVFVNVGRGNVIPESEIVEALERKWISGAILDVFNEEPLSGQSKLWSMPNVILTPHVSGMSLTQEVVDFFVENVKLYENGQPLNHVFSWSKGY